MLFETLTPLPPPKYQVYKGGKDKNLNEIFERMGPILSDFLLGIKKLQTPVFPLKLQKEVYFLGIIRYYIHSLALYTCLNTVLAFVVKAKKRY